MTGENEQLFDLGPYSTEEKERQAPRSPEEKALDRLLGIEDRLLKNLEGRLNRGERLTTGEYGILADLRQRLESRSRESLPEHFVPTAEKVAEFFGKTIRTIRNWSGRGMPQLPKGYDLEAVELWAINEGLIKTRKISSGAEASKQEGSEVPDRAFYESEIKRLDAALKEVKLQQATGVLILKADVEKGWVVRAIEFKRELLGMARRLSLRGANKDAAALHEIIRQDCMNVLAKYARGFVDVEALPPDGEGENG